MKKFLIASLAFVIATMALYGCDKEAAAPVLTEITGTWKYIGYSGGLAGFGFTPVDTVENYIQVDTASARIMFKSGTDQQCTAYTFEKNSNGGYSGIITLADTVHYVKQYDVYLSHDTLSLYPHNWADAFSAHYKISSKHFDWCSSNNNGN